MRRLPLVTLLVFAAACGHDVTSPAPTDLASQFAKGGGKGGPGGGAPTYALTMDDAGALGSDGAGPYVHKQDHVSLDLGGRLWFETFDGRGRSSVVRRVCVDFSSPLAVHLPAELDKLAADAGAGWPGNVCSDVTAHTRQVDPAALPVGAVATDGGKMSFLELGDGAAWEWRLLFDTRLDGGGWGGDGLCIHRVSETRWSFTAGTGACPSGSDDILELWHSTGNEIVHVADYRMPFVWTVDAI